MSQTPATPHEVSDVGRWSDVLTGRLGVYTLVLNLGMMLFATTNFVVIAIMPTVAADIGGLRFYSWVFALFSVGSVIGAAGIGPFYEAFGHRNAYAGAGVVFVVGLVGAALAPNTEVLVVWRLIQGVGGGAIASQGYALIAEMFPEHLRGRALGLVSTTWGVATALGPTFGGIYAEFGLWRSAFATLAALAVVFAWLAWRVVPQAAHGGRLANFPIARLALLGSSVLGLSMTSQLDDNRARAAFLIVGLALAAIAFRRDAKAERSLFPRKAMIVNSELGAAYWIMIMATNTMIFTNLYVTLYLQALHGVTPLIAAFIYVIYSVTWSGAAFIAAHLSGNRESASIIFGLFLMLVGVAGIAWSVTAGPVWVIAVFLGVVGAGMGFINNPLIQRAIAAAPPDERARTGSSGQAVRNLGYSFGAALAGMVAAVAGLTDTASPEILGSAMTWVYGVGGAFPTIGLLLTVFLIVHGLRRVRAQA